MVLKQTFIYLLARGIPGILSFLAVFYFSHMLSPNDFGIYSLVFSTAGMISVFAFQWLNVGLMRFRNKTSFKDEVIVSSIIKSYLIALLIALIPTSIAVFLLYPKYWLILPLLAFMSLYELLKDFSVAEIKPKKYALIVASKTIIGLSLAMFMLHLNFGYLGILAGLIIGYIIPSSLLLIGVIKKFKLADYDSVFMRKFASYSIPLAATVICSFVVNYSDRLLLSIFSTLDDVGIYSFNYDIVDKSLGMIMSIISMASFPLAVKYFESEKEKLNEHLSNSITLFFLISLPFCVGIISIIPELLDLFIDPRYSYRAADIISIVSISVFILGLKARYFDFAFQLMEKTKEQFSLLAIVAVVNVILNIIFIPIIGIMGAVYSTFISFCLATFLSWFWGRRYLVLPFPIGQIMPTVLACFIFYVINISLPIIGNSILMIIIKVFISILVLGITLMVFNVYNIRNLIIRE